MFPLFLRLYRLTSLKVHGATAKLKRCCTHIRTQARAGAQSSYIRTRNFNARAWYKCITHYTHTHARACAHAKTNSCHAIWPPPQAPGFSTPLELEPVWNNVTHSFFVERGPPPPRSSRGRRPRS